MQLPGAIVQGALLIAATRQNDETYAHNLDIRSPRTHSFGNQDRTIKDAIMADVRVARHTEFIQKTVILRETAGLKSR